MQGCSFADRTRLGCKLKCNQEPPCISLLMSQSEGRVPASLSPSILGVKARICSWALPVEKLPPAGHHRPLQTLGQQQGAASAWDPAPRLSGRSPASPGRTCGVAFWKEPAFASPALPPAHWGCPGFTPEPAGSRLGRGCGSRAGAEGRSARGTGSAGRAASREPGGQVCPDCLPPNPQGRTEGLCGPGADASYRSPFPGNLTARW